MKKRTFIMGKALGALWLAGGALVAQEAQRSADEIAKELANPNTPLATLNIKNQFRWFDGDLPHASDQFGVSTLFQPAFPFSLDNGDTVFFRPAVPIFFYQPVFDSIDLDFKSESGIGDIAFDLAYGRTSKSGFLWAAGLVSTVPTASSSLLGSGQWSLGPEFLLGKLTPDYVIGIFPNHQWDIAGWTDNSVNLTTIQAFLTWLPGDGWNVGSSPIMTYDWDAKQWTIPLNFQIGKTVILGTTPWKISLEVNYYVDKPDAFGPEWMVGINLAPVVKNVFASLFD